MPTVWSARHRKSPDASPVNTRPVRLPPWAAGARPTMRIRASGSPNPGSGRPQYGSSLNLATFSRATSSRQPTSRGHRKQFTISVESSVSATRSVTASLSEQQLVEPPRDDDQPNEAHHRQIHDMDERRGPNDADRQRAKQV